MFADDAVHRTLPLGSKVILPKVWVWNVSGHDVSCVGRRVVGENDVKRFAVCKIEQEIAGERLVVGLFIDDLTLSDGGFHCLFANPS
ncbi:MAG: hypothetical protein LH660_16015 [Phormidesmis sp. CAN_BIN36]|nr:hypothetical protein [Phormidesmis sp. CAN_BIN36]